MFNSKYACLSENIMEKYERLCSIFLSKAENENIRKKMERYTL